MDDEPVAQLQRRVDQRGLGVAGAQALVGDRRARRGLAQAQLVEPRALAHAHREAARRNLHPQRPVVAGRRLVEGRAAIDDEAHENIEPAGRAFRIGGAGQRIGQRQPLGERGDIDDALLQHRAFAFERDALRRQALQPLAHIRAAAGQEARAQAIGLLAKPEIEARRLDLRRLDDCARPRSRPSRRARRGAGAAAGRRGGRQGSWRVL